MYLGNKAFKPQRALNAAIFDSLMVGVACRLRKGKIQNGASLKRAYQGLLNNASYVSATETATTDVENVDNRIKLAVNAFDKIE